MSINLRLRQQRAWTFVLPSEIFLWKYVLAYWLPDFEIWDKAIRWIAILSLLFPDFVLICLNVLPDDFSLGQSPAYLAKEWGDWNLSIFLTSANTWEAKTTPQPFNVSSFWLVCWIKQLSSCSISFVSSRISSNRLTFLLIWFLRFIWGWQFGDWMLCEYVRRLYIYIMQS